MSIEGTGLDLNSLTTTTTLHNNNNNNNNEIQNNPLFSSDLALQFPSSQVFALDVHNPNPNISDHHHHHHYSAGFAVTSSQPPPPSSSSSHPTINNPVLCKQEQAFFPRYSSSTAKRSGGGERSFCHSGSSNPRNIGDKKVSRRILESGFRAKGDLSVSLNLVVCHGCPTTMLSSEGNKEEEETDEEAVGDFKRRRRTGTTPSNSVERLNFQSEVLLLDERRSPLSLEDDLDLELRLGDRPKVK